jgi:hypothetical protein
MPPFLFGGIGRDHDQKALQRMRAEKIRRSIDAPHSMTAAFRDGA